MSGGFVKSIEPGRMVAPGRLTVESGEQRHAAGTFLFSWKLPGGRRSFRFRGSFAFNEDPLNIQKQP